MMESAKYPGFAIHRGHHKDLTRQVTDFIDRYKRDDVKLNIDLLRFLSDWFTKHIQQENKKYGPWVKKTGAQ